MVGHAHKGYLSFVRHLGTTLHKIQESKPGFWSTFFQDLVLCPWENHFPLVRLNNVPNQFWRESLEFYRGFHLVGDLQHAHALFSLPQLCISTCTVCVCERVHLCIRRHTHSDICPKAFQSLIHLGMPDTMPGTKEELNKCSLSRGMNTFIHNQEETEFNSPFKNSGGPK